MQPSRILYLPIEHVQRELDGKLLLALEAVSRGYTVVLGEHERLNKRATRLPPGVYLYKDCASWQAAKIFPGLKQRNHKITALDEEGLIFRSKEAYLRERVDSDAIKHLDILFAWGQLQKRVLLEKQGLREDIIRVVGNPRLDLCRLSPSAVHPDSPFTVLVNTRFSIINGHKPAEQVIDSLRRLKVIRGEEDESFFTAFMARDKPLLEATVEAVKKISGLDKKIRVIVRPHPAESSDLYIKEFNELENVAVDNSTSLTEQLSISNIVLHEGCTTAIEAALMGKPSIALELTPPLSPYQSLPNSFSTVCHSIDEAISVVHQAYRGEISATSKITEKALDALQNASGEFSFVRIMNAIDTLGAAPQCVKALRNALGKGQRIKDIKLRYKHMLHLYLIPRLLNKSATETSRRAASLANKNAKFPLLSRDAFQNRLSIIKSLYPNNVEPQVTLIDAQTVLLSRREN